MQMGFFPFCAAKLVTFFCSAKFLGDFFLCRGDFFVFEGGFRKIVRGNAGGVALPLRDFW